MSPVVPHEPALRLYMEPETARPETPAASPKGWLPIETFLPAPVQSYEAGEKVLWIDWKEVRFGRDRVLRPGDVLRLRGGPFLWAGPEHRSEAGIAMRLAVLRLPDGTKAVSTVMQVFDAIRSRAPQLAAEQG